MFSFLFKRKKNTEALPNVSNSKMGEALEKSLTEQNVEPKQCVASESSSFRFRPQQTHVTLVQGSSNTKPKDTLASENEEPNHTDTITRDLRGQVTSNPRMTNMPHLHKAPPCSETSTTVTTPRLYPHLDQIGHTNYSQMVNAKLIRLKKLESIHNVAEEIRCSIVPRILYANTFKTELDQLKGSARKQVLAIYNIIENSSKLEYTFNKELDVMETSSYVNGYDTLHTFDDVRLCHKRATEPFSNYTKTVPIFQTYTMKLRCYKGQRGDIVDCD